MTGAALLLAFCGAAGAAQGPVSLEGAALAGRLRFDNASAVAPLAAVPASVLSATGLGVQAPDGAPLPLPLDRAIISALPEDSAWLESVIRTAQASPTARAVLADVSALAARRGQPVVVAALPTAEAGAFDWNDDVVWLRGGLKKKPLPAAAATLIHELRHAVQKEWSLPFDAAELELDAYVIDFSVSHELRDNRPMDKYDARAIRAFKKGVRPFQRFLEKEYPNDLWLGRSVDAYVQRVRGLREAELKDAARLTKRVSDKRRVLESMRKANYSESSMQAFIEAEIKPLTARLDDVLGALRWRDRDLALLSSPEARARYAEFARDARRRASRAARRLRGR